MSFDSSWTRVKYAVASVLATVAIGTAFNFVGCGTSTTTTTSATSDPFLYTAYYPADVAYSTVYWTDDWAYTGLYALATGVVVVSDAGATPFAPAPTTTTTTGMITTAGDVVRALARGVSVCQNQVTVTPKTAAPVCAHGTTRAGVTIVFNGCHTPGGSTIDGTIDTTSTRTASATNCDATTSVMLTHTTTITNLSYTAANGQKLVIPSQTVTGGTAYTFGQIPPTVTVSYTGQLQRIAAGGGVVADHGFTATASYSFAGSSEAYTVDGGVTVVDNLSAGSGATITLTGLKRVTTCCRPVGGMIAIVQTGATGPGTHTWTFERCGDADVDGSNATLPACI
jgi:hypothetical protein